MKPIATRITDKELDELNRASREGRIKALGQGKFKILQSKPKNKTYASDVQGKVTKVK